MATRRDHCKGCDRHVDECGPLSQRYLCEDCSYSRQRANMRAMIERRGPLYHRWLANTARGLGVELPEGDRDHG